METKQNSFSFYKKLFHVAWPLILANSFWNLQLTIDRVFLASFSTETLAAAGLVSAVFWTPMALLQQTSAYVTTFVAQYFGAHKKSEMASSLWQSLYLSLVGGLLFLGLIFASPYFFPLLGHGKTLTQLEGLYFNALCFSALPTAIVASFSGFFSGLGKTKTILIINGSGLLANILFDYLLIFGNGGFPELGIVGAGYATALSAGISALSAAALLFLSPLQKEYQFFKYAKINWDLVWRQIRFGLPSGMQWALEGMAFTVFQVLVGQMPNGPIALASTSIAVTIMMLSTLPAIGLAQAVLVCVGQELGKQETPKAEGFAWTGVKMALMYIVPISLTFIFIPQFYIGWFENASSSDLWTEVKNLTPHLLIFVTIFTICDSVYFNFSFALKGAGDTRFVSLLALLLPWPLMILPTYLMRDTPNAIYWGWTAASFYAFCTTAAIFFRFKGGKWKSMSVIEI